MFGEINKIRALATKYSKQELASLVRNQQVSLQDASLAGMMIDRIAKSAMQPPQTTVAEDILSPQQATGQIPPSQMEQEPQMPPEQAPQMAADGGLMGMLPHSHGVASLHSGLHNMAGGGIVAFADGGDVPSFAGDNGSYIDSNLFKSVIAAESRGDPNAVSRKGARGLSQLMPKTARDPGFGVEGVKDNSPEENVRVGKDYLNALLKKYGNMDYALAAYNWGPGNTDKWIARGAKPEELPAETRNYIPKVKAGMAQMQDKISVPAKDILSNLENFLPSAQAAEKSRAPAASAKKEMPTGDYYQDPFGAPDYTTEGWTPKQQVEKGKYYEPSLQGAIFGYEQVEPRKQLPPITPPRKDVVANPLNVPKETQPAPQPEKAPMGPARPTLADQLGNFAGETIDVPQEKTLKSVVAEQAEADKAYGANPQKMFDDIRAEYKNSQGDNKERKDKALGAALMMWGLGFMGARKGREFEAVSKSGQQALNIYTNSMDKINDNEDKLRQRMQDLSIAENQYKVSRSDKALSELQSNKREIRAIELENAKLKNHALIESKKLAVDMFKNENPALYQTLENIAVEQRAKGNKGYTALDALKDYQGVSKTGEVSRDKAYMEWAKDLTLQSKFPKFDDYYAGFQNDSGFRKSTGKVKFLGFE